MQQKQSAENDQKLLAEKAGDERPAAPEVLTLPEKLCSFYIQRPKLAFGKSIFLFTFLKYYTFDLLSKL